MTRRVRRRRRRQWTTIPITARLNKNTQNFNEKCLNRCLHKYYCYSYNIHPIYIQYTRSRLHYCSKISVYFFLWKFDLLIINDKFIIIIYISFDNLNWKIKCDCFYCIFINKMNEAWYNKEVRIGGSHSLGWGIINVDHW